MTVVKICGIRTVEEGRAALAAGADWLGFVLWPGSKRFVRLERAAQVVAALRDEDRDWKAVGVFVNPTLDDLARARAEAGLNFLQLAGDEDREFVAAAPGPIVKSLRVPEGDEERVARLVAEDTFGAERYLLDAHRTGQYGGTGSAFAWEKLASVGPRCIVAGGLTPENVGAAVAALAPWGVDVSSGVEHPGGGKDPERVRRFVEQVRTHDIAYQH